MIHQDGSTHEWVSGQKWDLIVTMDDAPNEHYSMFFVEEEGTASSFRGVREVIESRGLFASFYSDRGSHYWHTPEAGGKVDKINLTQFGQALQRLGIEMIAAIRPKPEDAPSECFVPIRSGYRVNLSLRVLPIWQRLTRMLHTAPGGDGRQHKMHAEALGCMDLLKE